MSDKTIRYYSDEQADTILKKVKDIKLQSEIAKSQLMEPTVNEHNAVLKVITDFAKKKKRKMYGGYAFNQLLINKDPKLALYKEHDMPDIDMYSNQPMEDLYDLCNLLDDAKFKYVTGTEAQHAETYTIKVNFKKICDITYVPTHVYNYMKTEEINGYHYIHPSVMMIDYFRQVNDPLTSYWLIDKFFCRLNLLQKEFPFRYTGDQVSIKPPSKKIRDLLLVIKTKFLTEEQHFKSLIILGHEAYNYYISVAKMQNILIEVPFLEFISTQYKHDVTELYNFIKSYLTTETIEHEEYYPLFQYTGYKSVILVDKVPVVVVYHNNNMCIPYNIFKLQYRDGEIRSHQFGTFTVLIMTLMIRALRSRMDKDIESHNNYNNMITNLITARNAFLEKNKLTPLDNSPYKEYQIQCVGSTVSFERKYLLRRMKKKECGKVPFYAYTPSTAKPEDKVYKKNFFFSNTSGNLITNSRNKKVDVTIDSKKQIENDEDEEECVEVDSETSDTKTE